MTKTFLSLITITHNDPGIKATIDSVQSQKFSGFEIEHIIVDNLSSDMTPYIVKEYKKQARYPVTYIREKDNGRYHAMNKGIKIAKGEYLLFLNALDTLASTKVLSQINLHHLNSDLAYGDIINHSLKNFKINPQFFLDRTLFHQATFIKKSLFDKIGPYDQKLIIASDFDFFIKAVVKNNATTQYLPLVITNYDQNGISSQQSDLLYAERAQVLARYFSGTTYLKNILKYFYYRHKSHFPQWFIKIQQQRLNNQPKI